MEREELNLTPRNTQCWPVARNSWSQAVVFAPLSDLLQHIRDALIQDFGLGHSRRVLGLGHKGIDVLAKLLRNLGRQLRSSSTMMNIHTLTQRLAP